tara:strand:- start:1406 stop:2428 length:1023 start_codon:yes stop_codon:yes gene_type:complete
MAQNNLNQKLKNNLGSTTLAELGEIELINRLSQFMDTNIIDNDTALIEPLKNEKLIINTDVLVENIHFSDKLSTPSDIGWKAITSNLSDLTCSGATKFLYFTIALIAPSSTSWKWVEGVYLGINEALKKYGGKLIGGDCSNGKQKILSITAIGSQGPIELNRSNAKAGDLIVSCGPHGLSQVGLLTLQNEDEIINLFPNSLKHIAIKSHRRPRPSVEALEALIRSMPNSCLKVAGTDSSDGLLEAVKSICRSSNCLAVLDQDNLPKHSYWPNNRDLDHLCLSGGEDYELIICLPKNLANKLINEFPQSKIIGYMRKGEPKVIWKSGSEIILKNNLSFKHF